MADDIGEFFGSPDKLRSDANMIGRMLSMGVVSEERANALLVKTFELAESAADAKKARTLATLSKLLTTYIRLGQEERKMLVPKDSGVTVNIQNNDCSVAINDRRTELTGIIAAALERARAAEGGGVIDSTTNGQPEVPRPSAD